MQDEKEMRGVYCDTLIELAKTNKDICVVESDLTNCIKTGNFKKAYPDRFFNVGIQEANMVGVSAGLASCGKIPFCSSFATFATRRCFDQAFISVGYAKQNVKIVGTDPGISAEANGGTHMPFEDMGLMRAIPNMLCIEPTDAAMLANILPQIVNYNGPTYIRLFRKNCTTVYNSNEKFDLFKAKEIMSGNDVTIIASGIMVSRAVEAAEQLKAEGINARVLNTFTWKPIDKDAIIKAAKETKAIVVCENHNIVNGLFSAVSEIVCQNYPVAMESIACQNQFGQVGKMPFLSEAYELRVEDIIKKAKKAISRK